MEREIKGIYIPIEIWKDKNLSWNEKILFLEIDSFTSSEKECYISNEYISEFLGITTTNASKTLSSLVKKGYVEVSRFDGRRRYVKTTMRYSFSKADLSISTRQTCQQRQGSIDDVDNILNQSTYYNLQKEKEDINISSKKNGKNFICNEQQPNWREDFLTYRHIVDDAAKRLKDDVGQRNLFLKYNPNADYDMTIDKSVDMFWGTEDGWNHKKRSKSKNIDMVATLKKALQQRMNICYKPFEQRGSVMSDTSSGKKQGQLSMDDFIEMRRKAGRPI